jgi:hypothetical protein
MGFFDAMDKLANGGRKSAMTPAQHARAKANAKTANELGKLADAANNYGTSRTESRKAREELERALGKAGAKKAMAASSKKARGK